MIYATLKELDKTGLQTSVLRKNAKGKQRIPYYKIMEQCGLPFAIECASATKRYDKIWRTIAIEYAVLTTTYVGQNIYDSVIAARQYLDGRITSEMMREAFNRSLADSELGNMKGMQYKAAVSCIFSAHQCPYTALRWTSLWAANNEIKRKEQETIFYNATKFLDR